MIDEKSKCENCGRPLPNHPGRRCDACEADRNANFAKIGGMIGGMVLTAVSTVVALLVGRGGSGRRS